MGYPNRKEIIALVKKQLNNLFNLDEKEIPTLEEAIDLALRKTKENFKYHNNKYFWENEQLIFDPYHSGQYAIFLYYLSNIVQTCSKSLADRIYYLNKALNGVELFYEVELPDIFFLEHPIGSVMGRANYSNYFSFSQNCTVGNNKGVYPSFEENVTMLSGSKVIGDCIIGKNTIISANTYIKDTNIPPNSIVFGSSPNLIIKERKHGINHGEYWIF
ncbi:transferase [Lysinibacillus boronitolerans]|uniref:transferase n=1 Tax=Lysinibacillus boronitolerans TaxID=309788 RepID=UPI00289D37C3|nr:transferase [Lysinibacillus boronitolerans]